MDGTDFDQTKARRPAGGVHPLAAAVALALAGALAGCATQSLPPDASEVDRAKAAFARKDYAEAARLLSEPAMKGDPGAQYALGYLYYYGQGVPQDFYRARTWLETSAQLGNREAKRALATLKVYGKLPKVADTASPPVAAAVVPAGPAPEKAAAVPVQQREESAAASPATGPATAPPAGAMPETAVAPAPVAPASEVKDAPVADAAPVAPPAPTASTAPVTPAPAASVAPGVAPQAPVAKDAPDVNAPVAIVPTLPAAPVAKDVPDRTAPVAIVPALPTAPVGAVPAESPRPAPAAPVLPLKNSTPESDTARAGAAAIIPGEKAPEPALQAQSPAAPAESAGEATPPSAPAIEQTPDELPGQPGAMAQESGSEPVARSLALERPAPAPVTLVPGSEQAQPVIRKPVSHGERPRYTIHLLSSPSKEELLHTVRAFGLAQAAWYPVYQGNATRYRLIFGGYETLAEAHAAMRALPQPLYARNPWVNNYPASVTITAFNGIPTARVAAVERDILR